LSASAETTKMSTLELMATNSSTHSIPVHLGHGQIHRHHIGLRAQETFPRPRGRCSPATDHFQTRDLLRAFYASPNDIRIIDDHQLSGKPWAQPQLAITLLPCSPRAWPGACST